MSWIKTFTLALYISLLYSCSNSNEDRVCETESNLISSYTNPEGIMVQTYESGNTYITNNECTFAEQSFDPDFYHQNYIDQGATTFIKVNDTDLYEVNKNFSDNFENYDNLNSLILSDLNRRDKIYTNLTLQSPATPTVPEYNDLKNCILNNTCDFIDNRVALTQDPADSDNQVLGFYSVAPSEDMIVAKSSIATETILFREGEDLWFQMKIYIDGNLPQTIADFESSFISGSPGPRISISNDEIEIENKFGAKLKYKQDEENAVKLPTQQWVNIKVHFQFDTDNGILQLWQDDQLIIDETGRNMPFDFWILNSLQIGITATQEESTLLVDDFIFSDSPL